MKLNIPEKRKRYDRHATEIILILEMAFLLTANNYLTFFPSTRYYYCLFFLRKPKYKAQVVALSLNVDVKKNVCRAKHLAYRFLRLLIPTVMALKLGLPDRKSGSKWSCIAVLSPIFHKQKYISIQINQRVYEITYGIFMSINLYMLLGI